MGAAAFRGRRGCRAVSVRLWPGDQLVDRPADVDGDRNEELNPAGGIRHHGAGKVRHGPLRCAHRFLLQARPSHRYDFHRHDRGHDAGGHGLGRRSEFPLAHGSRGNWWTDCIHRHEPVHRPGGVHLR